MHSKALTVFALFMSLSATASGTGDQGFAYSVVQKFALQKVRHGVEGELQLLLDRRLTESVRQELWGQGDWSFVFPPDSELYKRFSISPPRRSHLSIRDKGGKLLVERELEMPLARLKVLDPMAGANRLFLLTQDYSAGVGSYNGLGTVLLEVSGPAIQEISALSMESHQDELIRLAKSLKSDWRVTRTKTGVEILSISCHPKDGGDFVVDYVRYSFDGTRWLKYKRSVEGIWESDQPFPERKLFP